MELERDAPVRPGLHLERTTDVTNDSEYAAEEPAPRAGWGGDEVVRDHSNKSHGASGWAADEVVRDHGERTERETQEPADWSADEVVRDHGETSDGGAAGGWSADEVVKDAGE